MAGDAGEQLGEAKRLEDVVDSAAVQTVDDLEFRRPGGQHDDRELWVRAEQLFAQGDAVTVGQRSVEDDEPWATLGDGEASFGQRCNPA